MVVGAFPLAKLGILLFRQVSKPVANFLKERAKNHPFFRKYVCMPTAQGYNWCEIRLRMYFLNLGKPVNIPKLNEAQAIELGANLLGEIIVFGSTVSAAVYEWNRGRLKQIAKEKEDEERITNLQYTIQELCIQNERIEAQLRHVQRHVFDLETQVVKKPWSHNQLSSSQDQNNSSQVNKEETVISEALNYIEKDILNGSKANRNVHQSG